MWKFIALTAVGLCLGGAARAQQTLASPDPAGPSKTPPFFLFSDTQVSYYYIPNGRTPGQTSPKSGDFLDGRNIPRNTLNIFHTDAWEYGTNSLSLDIIRYGSQDPAGRGLPYIQNYDFGSTEAYGIYRGTLSLNAMTGTKVFAIPGLVKDISLAYGFDLNTKNNSFGPETRKVLGGLSFALDVPVGFFNLGVYAQKEWNRNGLAGAPYRNVEFSTVPHIETVFKFPLTFTDLPLSVSGFNSINLYTGREWFGQPVKTEWISRTTLALDLGKLIYDQPNRADVFVGFQYWLNKFGFDHRVTPGSEEKSLITGVTVHIF